MVPAAVLILIVLVSFLLFGCDRVQQEIKNNKTYEKISETVNNKLPFDLPKLPELPFDLPKLPKLPFDLPDPSKLLGGKEPPDEEKIHTDEEEPHNEEGEKTTSPGVENETVMADENLFSDLPADWKHSNVKVITHNVDMKAGMDRVIVYMELETNYVYLTGTKEISYQLDNGTGEWKSTGPASKLSCLSIEPKSIPVQP